MKWRLLLLLGIICISACQKPNKDIGTKKVGGFDQTNFNKTSIELNNQAIEAVKNEILSERPDTAKMLQSLALLDSAISLDSSYYLAYSNKATVLCALDRKMESIRCLETLANRCPSYAEGTAVLGMLHESLGDHQKATTCYSRSLGVFQKRFLEKRDLSSRQNEVFMFLLLDKKDSVRVHLANLDAEFPSESKAVAAFVDFVRTFDRRAYISETCGKNLLR